MTGLLHSPTRLGDIALANRIVMAPMTRSRAAGNVPGAIMATYYGDRAGAGLIVTEGTSPSPDGLGYARIPGIFSDAQQAGWKAVTDAVHAKGGRIFVQLMHTGRIGHAANLPEGARVIAPSAIAAPGQMWTDAGGMQDHPVPAEMTEADIAKAIGEYAAAAKRAIAAGFDGVEVHAANGYLIDQFLNTATNRRTDRWGGSVENRIRFALEVSKAVATAIGAGRTGIRVSPHGVFNGLASDPETDALYARLARELGELGLVYLHVVDHSAQGAPAPGEALTAAMRKAFRGAYILSGGYDGARAEADLAAGKGDLVAFGRPFIGNPDLPARLAKGKALAAFDPGTLYTPGEKGYSDYPAAA
mgnify:FL=1